MRATPGACIKPGCLARGPLYHKVNLSASCEAQRLLCSLNRGFAVRDPYVQNMP